MSTLLTERSAVDNPKLPRLIKTATDIFEHMLDGVEIEIQEDDCYLVGPARLQNDHPWSKPDGERIDDNRHFPMGTGQLMSLGFRGIANVAAANSQRTRGLESEYLAAIARCYRVASEYVAKWALTAKVAAKNAEGQEDRDGLESISIGCESLAEDPPHSFQEALQLFWFALSMRNAGRSSTLGRLDQHFYPFYAHDTETGVVSREHAQEMIDELLEKINRIWTGDGLMTLVVGGLTRDGDDATNAVSLMLVDAAARLRLVNPQISVRIHDAPPEEFRDAVTELQLTPGGECTVLNDEAIIPALVASGTSLEMARNYCCDGCNELIYDGESMIEFFVMEAVKCLELTLFNGAECPVEAKREVRSNYLYADEKNPEVSTSMTIGHKSGDVTQMSSFTEVLDAFLDQFEFQVKARAVKLTGHVGDYRSHHISPPFLAGTFPECLETGRDLWRGGLSRRVFMIFSGSIPTVADGLAALNSVVFTDETATMTDLLAAIRADWNGFDALREQCLSAPKFGNDENGVDAIAAAIAERFSDCLGEFRTELPEPILPALFCHEFNRHAMIASATPDGRKRGDPIAEHFSPVPGRAVKGPTAVINSMARAPLEKMAGTAVTHVSLSRASLPVGAQAATLVRQLVDSAFAQGLMVIHMPVYDVDRLA